LSARQTLPWDDLLNLHVVKKVEKILNRRWNLGMGFADADGKTVRPPRTNRFAPQRGVCQVIHDRDAGEQACVATARQIAARFRGDAERRSLRARAVAIPCHAGLQEIAAPIIAGDVYLGALLCGGFLLTNGAGRATALAEVDKRTRSLALVPGDYQTAREHHPFLTADEISYVSELVEFAAEAIVEYHEEVTRHEQKTGEFDREFTTRYAYHGLIGRSRAMQDLYRLLDRVIESDSTVLVQGENGTGKELIARAIHYNSSRRSRRFVVQNCSAFNDNLLDSELFGHKKGAFTGAVSDKQGLFEVADQGTFFLDEVGDMSPALQVKLLRVLQEGTLTAVGDTDVKNVDVRIIAATNRNLRRMVDNSEFREDLYYRLNVINVVSPPLRDRRDDIALLVEHFLKRHAKGSRMKMKRLADDCLARLLEYAWPGNVRELENEIERLVVLAGDEKMIEIDLLSARIREQPSGAAHTPASPFALPDAIRALERRMIFEALSRNAWNKTRAAADLKISRRNLIRLVQKYELESRRS
jgi:transcriptional regulator with PAS, ATPase and Fis domain